MGATMGLKRAVLVTKINYAINALWAVAALAASIAVLRDPTTYPVWVVWLVVAVQIANAISIRRSLIAREVTGMWRERSETVAAMKEAYERGMSPGEFVIAWNDRLIAQAKAEGFADDEAKENPGQSED